MKERERYGALARNALRFEAKMKPAIFFGVILLTFGAFQKPEQPPEIGSKLLAKDVPKKNSQLFMTHSSQLRPFIRKEINNVDYVIAYDEKTREVRYLSTHDPDFKTSKGLKVGDYIEVKGEEVVAYPGWEIRGPEEGDGWQPLIGYDIELTVMQIGVGSKWLARLSDEETMNVQIIAFVKGGN